MLKAFDIFKGNPQMHFNGEKGGFSSWLGRIMTILVFGFGTSLLIYFSLDMILKINPLIQSSPLGEIDDIIITEESFPFAFGLKDASGKFYIDERIYTVKAVSDNLRIPYLMIPCKPTYFEGYDPEKDGPLWCFSKEQNPGTIVKTSSADALTINLHRCDKTERQDCFEEEEIDKLLEGNRVGIYRKQFGYDANNYKNPITERTVYVGASVSHVVVKESYLYLNRYYYDTDDGWLFSDLHREIRINADTFIEYFEDKKVMGNIFKQIGFDTNNQSIRLLRKYDNVPTIFARWNGMFTIMLLIGKIISDAYNQFKTQEALIKDILSIKNRKSRAQNIRNKLKEDKMSPQKLNKNDEILLKSSNSTKESRVYHPGNGSSNFFTSSGKNPLNINFSNKDIEQNFSTLNNPKTSKQEKFIKDTDDLEKRPSKRSIDENFTIELEIHNQDDGKATNHFGNENNTQESNKKPKSKAPIKKKPSKSTKKGVTFNPAEELPEIGFWTWICSKLKLTRQYKIFLEREKLIKKEFDFQSQVKKLIEIDVLKYLLFTKNQLALFENCTKAYVNSKLYSAVHMDINTDNKLEDYGKMHYSSEEEDNALIQLRQMDDPDAITRKVLHLLEVLFSVEEKEKIE